MAGRYQKIKFLGEGTFATVYSAYDLDDPAPEKRIVAIKKIKIRSSRDNMRDGVDRSALREIKLLRELNHENILSLIDVFGRPGQSISLVFEFMETDLSKILTNENLILTPEDNKNFILQMLIGLDYLHKNWVLHRDMKPDNLLIDKLGVLKIGDFGLARQFGSPNKEMTRQVVTRWYRCPELMLGSHNYGTSVDIWAAGCIIAEIILRRPFIISEADSDISQLSKIFEIFGTPTDENWPAYRKIDMPLRFKPMHKKSLRDEFFTNVSFVPDDLLSLMEKFFWFDPLKRITAEAALKSDYFKNLPYPTKTKHQFWVKDGSNKQEDQKNKIEKKFTRKRKLDFSNDDLEIF